MDIKINDIVYWQPDRYNVMSGRVIENHSTWVKVLYDEDETLPSNTIINKSLLSKNRKDFATLDDLVSILGKGLKNNQK